MDAISVNGGNILVSAAAGSGKTAVLVERVIRKITDNNNPFDIDDFLIVTFTKAAAAEMKERIYKTIESYCLNDPENENLQRQLILCNKAKITTIDSFCYDIVKKYGYSIGIPYDFNIGDESKINIIKNDCLHKLIEEYYDEKNDKDFLNLVKLFCDEKNDDKLFEVLLMMYNFVSKQPFADIWLEDNISEYKKAFTTPYETKWFKEIVFEFSLKLDYFIGKYNKAIEFIQTIEPLKGYESKILSDFEYINNLKSTLEGQDFNEIAELLKNIPSGVIGRVSGFDGVEKKFCSDTRSEFISFIKDSVQLFNVCDKTILKSIEFHIPIIEKLIEIIKKLDNRIFLSCIEEKTFSFVEIENAALRILVESYDFENDILEKSDISKEISKEFKEIFIDEFQDINLLQELVFRAVSNEKNVYMVGDVKQSIYRFRQAMPEIFISKRKSYNPVSQNEFPCLITLNNNFRSKKNILDFSNFVFSQLFSEQVGEIKYDESEMLYPGKESDGDDGVVDITLLENKRDDYEDDILELSSVEREAIYIAEKIREIIDDKEKIVDDGVVRAIKYSDIAVLFRNKSRISDALIKEFKKRNIPFISDEKKDYLKCYEISSFISFLKVLDNPSDDISVLSALRSPVFSFSFDELMEIRNIDKKEKFYSLLEKSDNEKCKQFIRDVRKYRELSRNVTVDTLISKIINNYDVITMYETVSETYNKENGDGIRENIQMLYDYAVSFEKSGYKGLGAFIKYIDDILKNKGDLVGGKKVSQAENAVNILTIHKSKGLEFPVCFLCGLSKPFNKMDFRNNLLLNYFSGFGFKVKNFDEDYYFDNYIRKSIASRMMREFYSEELRILYVALTRPKNYLYLVLSYKTNENKDIFDVLSKKSYEITDSEISPNSILECNSFTDMLTFSLLRHSDFKSIRESARINLLPLYHQGNICVNIIDDSFFYYLDMDVSEKSVKRKTKLYSDKEDFDKRLSFKYQKGYLSSIPAKLSVSELKGRNYLKTQGDKEIGYFYNFRRPYFISETKNPAERGTAYHKFMQYLDYRKVDKDNIELYVDELVSKGYLTSQEKSLININHFKNYLDSDLFIKIKNSKEIIREHRFNIEIPVNMYDNEIEDEENKILVQGVIDCIFKDSNGDYYILDYKTDKADLNELVSRYKKQLDLYEISAEQIFKIKVKSKVIYSFNENKEIYF